MSESKFSWARVWEFSRKYILNKYIIVLIIFGVVMVFVGNQSAIQRIHRTQTIDSLRHELNMYNEKTEHIDKKMQNLRTDKDSLERFARERYLMHCDDEDVYIVTDTID